jgi:class 3 adenylate cyclase
MTGDESFKRWFAKLERLGASPGNMLALLQLHREVDVRPVLPAIRVPTLVLHRAGDAYREVGHGRYLAAHIAGAKCVELPGRDHLPYAGDQDAVLDEVEEFLTGVRRGPEPDRVLATLLLGLELRSGLHTGEIELAGEHIRGIAVHIGARVMSMAGPGEALVSSTVKDLVAGSRIEFEDRGEHTLKGAPRMWRIFLAVSA